ncbi:MAG TPA: folylpolyglutamate synthase/dihydrofolate synthase family protein [Rickettsiales bacterium]|nr:folylpolyglutamate synthase/dihydrofolate synthase family protein [Rickettsiales bacterium]
MAPSFLSPYALHMPHWPKPLGPEPQGTPSERARKLLAKMGYPEKRLPPVVHVGGTKGKGSTIAFMRTMLEAAGYRVHTYTSPHIERFNERIVLSGREIGDETLQEVLEATRMAAGDMDVGFFDATTAAATLAFANHPADVLLMEMGLGGTVDATNIIDSPLLTVLTTISYDHMEYMGNTLDSIARFEAGILKPDVPCIVSYQPPEALESLEREATRINAPLHIYGKHWLTRKTPEGMLYADADAEAKLPLPSLLGAHQIVNAGNAIAAISALQDFNVESSHVVRGLMQAQWKGRLQKMDYHDLPSGCELWFDGGHNMAAAGVIAYHAQQYWQEKPFYLIFGTTEGKDVPSMLAPFTAIAKQIYAVPVKSEPRSYKAETIRDLSAPLAVKACESIQDALNDIMRNAKEPFRVLVFGSLYLWLETKYL